MSRRSVRFTELGNWTYQRAWDFQESIFTEVVDRKSANRKLPEEERIATHDTLLFVEHPHVYTLGKSGDFGNLLADDERLKSIGAEFYRTNRGGDITYHGPGQLVGYPILDLDEHFTDIHRYLRTLEEVIIATLADYGLSGDRSPGGREIVVLPTIRPCTPSATQVSTTEARPSSARSGATLTKIGGLSGTLATA